VTSRPFQFHPEAELELTEAAEWYEERGAGLGGFLRSVRAKVDEITACPRTLAKCSRNQARIGGAFSVRSRVSRIAGRHDPYHRDCTCPATPKVLVGALVQRPAAHQACCLVLTSRRLKT
jgi:hypothetical protein